MVTDVEELHSMIAELQAMGRLTAKCSNALNEIISMLRDAAHGEYPDFECPNLGDGNADRYCAADMQCLHCEFHKLMEKFDVKLVDDGPGKYRWTIEEMVEVPK